MKTIFLSYVILSAAGAFGGEVKNNHLMIDPSSRALDYQQVYELLRKEKPANKICITLFNGTVLSSIIGMQKMDNSTLFLIRYNSSQGIKLQVVGLEAIEGISYLE